MTGQQHERERTPSWVMLLVVPLVIGSLTGLIVGALVDLIEKFILEDVVLGLPGLWFAVPAAFVFVLTRLAMVYVTRTTKPGTADLYPTYHHHDEKRYPLGEVPGRTLASAATVGLGGSQGLESQSVMVGNALGITLRRLTKDSYLGTAEGRKLVLVCGASAGIATVFSSPILGAIYGIEMPFKNQLDARRLIPSMIAAGASFMTAHLIDSARDLFYYVAHPIAIKEMLGVLIVAILCGLGARAFTWGMHRVKSYKDGPHPWLRATAAGVALALLAAGAWTVTGAAITAGPGYIASDWMMPLEGAGATPALWLVLIALVFRVGSVLVSVGGGGGGGVFTSLATNGLFIGVAVAIVLGLDNVTLLAAIGACAFLGAGYRIPLAAGGLLVETTAAALPSALGLGAIAIAMVIMGKHSASDTQIDDNDIQVRTGNF